MAHGREGPDLVMTTRYASASDVRSVSRHELNRDPDGSSAIDPERSHLNAILHGPASQTEALESLWSEGVRPPTAQAESPFVQMVLSASPEYFRDEGQGPGEWDQDRMELWRDTTMQWLRDEYGADLAHVSIHLDEDTPHMHVLIVPTYEKKARKPGKAAKGETLEEFEARKSAAEARPTIRSAARSSNGYWSVAGCRRIARQSYHAALDREGLGIGYGRDFVEESAPSPERQATAKWVREQAAKLAIERGNLAHEVAQAEAVTAEAEADRRAAALDRKAAKAVKTAALDDAAKIRADATEDRKAAAGTLADSEVAKVAAVKAQTEAEAARDTAVADLEAAKTERAEAAQALAEAKAARSAAEADQAKAANLVETAQADATAAAVDRKDAKTDRMGAQAERESAMQTSRTLNSLMETLQKGLKAMQRLVPGVQSLLRDAEASKAERAAAAEALREVEKLELEVKRDLSMTRSVMAGLRNLKPSAPEQRPDTVEEAGPGFDGP